MARKKVLLMGKAHSGKTSMRSIIFANYLARDTMRLSPTLDVEHHHVRFLGDLVLNLWDCGGQDAFYESYFERDRETIFRSVELLIYVFDIASDCPEKDFDHFSGVLEAIEENSPDARIFVLVHKMDLVAKEEQEMILEDRRRLIEESCKSCGVDNFQCFGTSIWDETLYKAWSEIVTNLIPNIGILESHLDHFCTICDADEVVLFEKATFLVISHSHGGQTQIADSTAHVALTPTPNDASNNTTNNNPGQDTTGTLSQDGLFINDTSTDRNIATSPSPPPDSSDPTASNVSSSQDPDSSFSTAAAAAVDGIITGVDSMSSSAFNHPLHTNTDTTSIMSDTNNNNNMDNDANSSTLASTATPGGTTLGITTTTHNSNNMTSSNPNQTLTSSNHNHNNNPTQNDPTTTTTTLKRKEKPHFDTHRFEKISNIVKQFKLSCEKAQSQFQGMEVANSHFKAFIDAFTVNTYIMVIVSNPNVHTGAVLVNIKNARRHFERFIPRS